MSEPPPHAARSTPRRPSWDGTRPLRRAVDRVVSGVGRGGCRRTDADDAPMPPGGQVTNFLLPSGGTAYHRRLNRIGARVHRRADGQCRPARKRRAHWLGAPVLSAASATLQNSNASLANPKVGS